MQNTNITTIGKTPMSPQIPENQAGIGAGWSSPVARQAHNLKVVGSNPTPATIVTCLDGPPTRRAFGISGNFLPHNDKM